MKNVTSTYHDALPGTRAHLDWSASAFGLVARLCCGAAGVDRGGADPARASAGLLAGVLIRDRVRFDAPPFFWPLLAYAASRWSSAFFSVDPAISFADDKQLLLFLVVPAVYFVAPAAAR